MNVYWTATAERHLDNIYNFIAQDSKTYALVTIDNITRKTQQIGQFPMSGRKVPEYDMEQIREVLFGSYRIIYHIRSERIDIIAVIHGAMNILRK